MDLLYVIDRLLDVVEPLSQVGLDIVNRLLDLANLLPQFGLVSMYTDDGCGCCLREVLEPADVGS